MEIDFGLRDLFIISPLIALFVGSLPPLFLKVFRGNKEINLAGSVLYALTGIMVSFGLLLVMERTNSYAFSQALKLDSAAVFTSLIVLISAAISIIYAKESSFTDRGLFSELLFLIMNSTLGMLVVIMSNDLIVLFIGIEVMSLCLYMAITLTYEEHLSKESALKYFILGSLASAIFLYGISFIYGSVGSTYLGQIGAVAAELISTSRIFLIGALMLTLGFFFKVAAFPFFSWAPDVYQGSPTPLTTFMATGVKIVSFYALLRWFGTNFLTGDRTIMIINSLEWLAALTILVGNFAAIMQDNLKRVFAYSGVAHTGYALLGLLAAGVGGDALAGGASMIFYLVAYAFMSLAAFGVINILEKRHSTLLNVSDLKGMGYSRPWLSAALTITLLSLAGIPPLMGFFSKFFVISAALKQGYIWLSVWAVIGSVISVFYYLRPIVNMYFSKDVSELVQVINYREKRFSIMAVLSFSAFLVIFGVFANNLYMYVLKSVMVLF